MDSVLAISESFGATLFRHGLIGESLKTFGRFHAECFDKDGRLKWVDDYPNLVVTLGKNFLLDSTLRGAAYTVTGPFMGLISSTSFSAIAAADTMASHAGWLEAGNANAPTYSGTRKTMAFNAASGGAINMSASSTFTMTGAGTVKGTFFTLGAGAVNTIDSTAGTLFSAGLFDTGDKVVSISDNLVCTWSLTLT